MTMLDEPGTAPAGRRRSAAAGDRPARDRGRASGGGAASRSAARGATDGRTARRSDTRRADPTRHVRNDRDGRPTRRSSRSRDHDTALPERRGERARRGYVPAARPAAERNDPGLFRRLRRLPLMVPLAALVVFTLGLTLWLSTKSAEDSYQLGVLRAENQTLSDRRDELKKSFESGSAAPELADKAAGLGMVPGLDPARLVVGRDGVARVIGEPVPAGGKAPGSLNPEPERDPVADIDPSTVDDSIGLGGTDGDRPADDARADREGAGEDPAPEGDRAAGSESAQPPADGDAADTPSPVEPAPPAEPAPAPAPEAATPDPR